jgi:hypothetical protein
MKIKNKEKIHQLITQIYQNRDGMSFDRDHLTTQSEYLNTTYYELQYNNGLDKIIDHLRITDDDVFVDLGCGIGRTVLEMFLSTPIKRAIGYELVDDRHQIAEEACRDLLENPLNSISSSKRRIQFLKEDIANADLRKVTIIYAASLSYKPELMNIIYEKMRKSRDLKAFFTLTPLPIKKNNFLQLIDEFPVDISPNTMSGVLCYMYAPINNGSGISKSRNDNANSSSHILRSSKKKNIILTSESSVTIDSMVPITEASIPDVAHKEMQSIVTEENVELNPGDKKEKKRGRPHKLLNDTIVSNAINDSNTKKKNKSKPKSNEENNQNVETKRKSIFSFLS